ncbi:hypothetical protein CSUB_C0617 [Candidatus Caldarchaeum subterraneum]|uniref:DUF3168 domain-containing protein n=1 Tax=Caldiarchaeum subterraneum TaxID=311458 RepID=E6N5V1_CALS0|nr:hypothetical protein HGMM_F32D08C36 [Candidatus Caldarchaeum subterraneum]BAJ50476.1 hypothetical protein CSUB_C0617 [Candidatus Caldarchaeum subterraneum]
MTWLTSLVEQLVQTIRGEAGIPVYVGWRPATTLPMATLQIRNCEITPLDLSANIHLITADVQIDFWHSSAKACDETVEKTLAALEQARGSLGIFFLGVEGLADVGDEKAFRKMLLLRLKTVK